MKAIDRIIEYLTDDGGVNDEHLKKYAPLWAVLFLIMGILMFVTAFLFATVPANSAELQTALAAIFALVGMLLILIGERLYRTHVIAHTKQ